MGIDGMHQGSIKNYIAFRGMYHMFGSVVHSGSLRALCVLFSSCRSPTSLIPRTCSAVPVTSCDTRFHASTKPTAPGVPKVADVPGIQRMTGTDGTVGTIATKGTVELR